MDGFQPAKNLFIFGVKLSRCNMRGSVFRASAPLIYIAISFKETHSVIT